MNWPLQRRQISKTQPNKTNQTKNPNKKRTTGIMQVLPTKIKHPPQRSMCDDYCLHLEQHYLVASELTSLGECCPLSFSTGKLSVKAHFTHLSIHFLPSFCRGNNPNITFAVQQFTPRKPPTSLC